MVKDMMAGARFGDIHGPDELEKPCKNGVGKRKTWEHEKWLINSNITSQTYNILPGNSEHM